MLTLSIARPGKLLILLHDGRSTPSLTLCNAKSLDSEFGLVVESFGSGKWGELSGDTGEASCWRREIRDRGSRADRLTFLVLEL